ncbi:MAG: hypothetical protein JSS51_08540, partial [Planctomycetes bacterium]|nr:hypothetical protein [Planctomycetota bacterium]
MTLLATLSLALLVSRTAIDPSAPAAPSAPASAPANDQPQASAPQETERPRRATVNGAMKVMDRALETLQGQIEDVSKHEENLALINDLERGCVMGKGLPLPEAMLEHAGTPEAKAELKRVYYSDMLGLLKKLILLEEAVLAKDSAAAKQRLLDVLAARDEGHQHMEPAEQNPFGFK